MSHIMLYVFPLILGRTFDLSSMRVGDDIFPSDQTENPIEIENPITETTYKIVDSTDEVQDLLDVSGSFSLNVKGGLLKAGASGAYMKDAYNKQTTVELTIKATFQTVTKTLRPSTKPSDAWMLQSGVGTHYVRSIIYGGEVIASVRLLCNTTRDKKRIKAALEGGGRLEVFDIGAEVEGEYFSDVGKSVDSMQINVYSSIPLKKIPHNMKELKSLLENFAADMKSFNDGKGVPLKVELWPLEYLNSTKPKFLKNRELESYLEVFEKKFDDLLNTKVAVKQWMKSMTETLTDKQEDIIGAFYGETLQTLKPFYEVIGKLDLSKGRDQLSAALKAYGKSLPGAFYQRYRKLRQEMVKDQGEWSQERGSGSTYFHWGKSSCNILAEQLYSGYAVGSLGKNGGSNFLCLQEKEKAKREISEENVAVITEASYKFPGSKSSSIPCASCRLPGRGSVHTFVGFSQCPRNWHLEYSGLLLGGRGSSTGADFLCLEKKPETLQDEAAKTAMLFPSWVTAEKQELLFPCVVCSK